MYTMAKRLFSGLASLVLCLMAVVPVLAVSQGAAWITVQGQQALVYLQGIGLDADLTCQIGSTLITPAQVQQIQELETPVHTVILVDNSVSIPSSQRPLVQEILEAVAGNHLQGEQFSVATISETVTWLCEAQTDYLQVKPVLDGIVYNDQQTRLTDCLYEVITYLQQQYHGQFCRIILVADGVDNQQVGYVVAGNGGLEDGVGVVGPRVSLILNDYVLVFLHELVEKRGHNFRCAGGVAASLPEPYGHFLSV